MYPHNSILTLGMLLNNTVQVLLYILVTCTCTIRNTVILFSLFLACFSLYITVLDIHIQERCVHHFSDRIIDYINIIHLSRNVNGMYLLTQNNKKDKTVGARHSGSSLVLFLYSSISHYTTYPVLEM